jgi:CRP-like cAMP-binding protein
LRRGTYLWERNQDGSGLFLIESGLVKLTRTSYDGRTIILSVMGQHQLAGVEALALVPDSHDKRAVCLTDVSGYRIPLTTARRLAGIPEIGNAILTYLIMRDHEVMGRMEMLMLHDVEHRVLHVLAELAQLVKPNADGSCYPIPITQMELASLVGATRETTSTTLSNLKNRQLVTLGRRMVTAVHPTLLLDAANDRLARVRSAAQRI